MLCKQALGKQISRIRTVLQKLLAYFNRQAEDITYTIFHRRLSYSRVAPFRFRVQFLKFLFSSNLNKTQVQPVLSCFLRTTPRTQLMWLRSKTGHQTALLTTLEQFPCCQTANGQIKSCKTLPPICAPSQVGRLAGQVVFKNKRRKMIAATTKIS
jgi:hypothetical protein